MSVVEAIIAGRWIGDGTTGNAFRPRVAADFSLDSWTDLTGQRSEALPPIPNVYVLQATMEDTVLADIRAANGVLVLWDDSQDMDAALTAGQRNAALTRLEALGYGATVIRQHVPAGITRRQAIARLVAVMRTAARG